MDIHVREAMLQKIQEDLVPPQTGDVLRWEVTVTYRSDHGAVLYTFSLEELADLGEVIERGPHWNTILDIRIERLIGPPDTRLTLETAVGL